MRTDEKWRLNVLHFIQRLNQKLDSKPLLPIYIFVTYLFLKKSMSSNLPVVVLLI